MSKFLDTIRFVVLTGVPRRAALANKIKFKKSTDAPYQSITTDVFDSIDVTARSNGRM